jgi:BMFP domain-containing protein YqiC
MQTKNPILDEMAKAFESAMGLAQAAGDEAKAAFRAQGDRLAAELDLVRRDELDALRDTLTAEIASLKAEIARLSPSTAQVRATDDGG